MTDRRSARRQLGSAAILSPSEAVELLPFRDAACREWLEAIGLIHQRPGLGAYVVWDEVVRALRDDPPAEPEPTKASGYPRVTLRGQR